jgi:hypothetical protein
MKWLSGPSPSAVAEALRAVVPELSALPVGIPDLAGQDDPVWQSASAVLGEDFFVKFAWSETAARRLLQQIRVLEALTREPAVPYLPQVVAAGTDPLIMVTRRVRGASLFAVADFINLDQAGLQIARFLAALHSEEARRRVEALTGVVPAWYPLVTTSALRERFGQWVSPEQQRQPGLVPGQAQGGPRLRECRRWRGGIRPARLPGTRYGRQAGAAERGHAPLRTDRRPRTVRRAHHGLASPPGPRRRAVAQRSRPSAPGPPGPRGVGRRNGRPFPLLRSDLIVRR